MTACSSEQEADIDFPSTSELENANSLAEVKAEEKTGVCSAKNVELVFTYPSGAKAIYEYGKIKAGDDKEPTLRISGDITFDDLSSGASRDEKYDTDECEKNGVLGLGTPLI